jgi:hypothetical protein
VARGLVSRARAKAIRVLGGGSSAPTAAAYVPPELNEVQRRVLDDLNRDGISVVPFAELFGEPALWEEMRGDMDAFAARARAQIVAGERQWGKKEEYLIRRYPRRGKMPVDPAVLATDGCWLRYAAGDALLSVVNSYRGGMTKLIDFDQWYTIPFEGEHERVASQQWHRDPEDQHVVKVFAYFNDVDEEAGPFEYVPESAAGMKYGHLWPWDEGTDYPPSEEVEGLIPESDRMLATGTAGTVIVCDTSGLHRGGYCRSKPRVLTMHTYVKRKVTPESKRRKFKVVWDEAAGALSEQARFALS